MIFPRPLLFIAFVFLAAHPGAIGQTPPTNPPGDAAPATGTAAAPSEKSGPRKGGGRGAAKQAASSAPKPAPHAEMEFPGAATETRNQAVAPPSPGERIVFIGNGLAERDVYYSRLETELHLRYPDARLLVRNMARTGDTPAFRPHPARVSQWAFPGAEAFRPEFKLHNGKGFFPLPDQWLTFLKADTIVAFFGYNESFDGPERVGNYEAELDAWVEHTLAQA